MELAGLENISSAIAERTHKSNDDVNSVANGAAKIFLTRYFYEVCFEQMRNKA